jgi:hypothetical protein
LYHHFHHLEKSLYTSKAATTRSRISAEKYLQGTATARGVQKTELQKKMVGEEGG